MRTKQIKKVGSLTSPFATSLRKSTYVLFLCQLNCRACLPEDEYSTCCSASSYDIFTLSTIFGASISPITNKNTNSKQQRRLTLVVELLCSRIISVFKISLLLKITFYLKKRRSFPKFSFFVKFSPLYIYIYHNNLSLCLLFVISFFSSLLPCLFYAG
jgi:hypothetical protein